MKIKVCGMTDSANIRDVEALGVEWMGFIFWPQSKRCCSVRPDYLPEHCKRVGVFVNAEVDDIVRHYLEYRLDAIQLHGDEDKMYVWKLRQALGALPDDQFRPYQLIKAVSLTSKADIAQKCEPLVGFVDLFLFDTPTAGRGGSGRTFDWSMLAAYNLMTPFLLSGGIGPESVDAVRSFSHPCCEGIDLNSRFESAPGIKDISKLREFIVQL
ncbi:MAG: phosphoribosylanthranilate isomerase [Bacteroidales bacterium]|nr:phosphoribosylanthranilate isomerase [Candidatus Liminaster caballi]